MGNQTPLEPVRGHHQVKEMVDPDHADPYVCSHADVAFPASAGHRRGNLSDTVVLCHIGDILGYSLCFRNA